MLQPKATFKFPLGEVSLVEREEEEVKKTLSISGIAKGQILNGICTAQYEEEDLKLRYCYKVLCSSHCIFSNFYYYCGLCRLPGYPPLVITMCVDERDI